MKWTVLSITAAFVIVVALSFAHMRIKTVRAMEHAAQFMGAGRTQGELRAVYGIPTELYSTWAEVPGKLQRGLEESADCEYHLYTREGLPYWYFVAAIDRTTRVVERGVATNY